jgi:predicted transcriptional regulator
MDPEPFGLAHIYQCIPYANPQLFRQDFEGAVQRGWLTIGTEGSYRATLKGQKFHRQLHQEIRRVYSNLHPLPMMQLERLDAILGEIITAIKGSNILNYRPAFEIDQKLAPKAQSTLQRICCKLAHLVAYRDDTYLNAWMEKEVNSYVWEAFSYIYKGQAQTAKTLARKLEAQRQYNEDAYAEAIQELVDRDWITCYRGKYEPTTAGLKVLAEVARKMTQNFFEPWINMNEAKLTQLQTLMEALLKGLKSPQTKRWQGKASASRNFGWRTAQWARDKVR